MLDFEFCIVTGNLPLMRCRQPVYEFYQRKNLNKFIDDLENSNPIRKCEGAWGSLLLLAAKPHQGSCEDIHAFLWKIYVDYRALNSITLWFEFPISHCVDSIEDLVDSCDTLCQIFLDARSGYHQIGVRKSDQEKLAFFTPIGSKKTYIVLPFRPTNDPVF